MVFPRAQARSQRLAHGRARTGVDAAGARDAAHWSHALRISQPVHLPGTMINCRAARMACHAPKKPSSAISAEGSVIIPHGRIFPSQVTQNVLLPARQRIRSAGSS